MWLTAEFYEVRSRLQPLCRDVTIALCRLQVSRVAFFFAKPGATVALFQSFKRAAPPMASTPKRPKSQADTMVLDVFAEQKFAATTSMKPPQLYRSSECAGGKHAEAYRTE